MLARRLAFFFALLCGGAMTQLPEYAQQYQQRLEGAIDELSTITAAFDRDSQAQGLSEQGGIQRLRDNPDEFVRQRGTQMAEITARLARLKDLRQMLRNRGPAERLGILAAHYDPRIAARTLETFEPAVPVSAEAFILGIIGFLGGGGAVHGTRFAMKRRAVRRRRDVPPEAV